MGVQRTRTVKNKHAANKSGITGSRSTKAGAQQSDGFVRSKKPKGTPPAQVKKGSRLAEKLKAQHRKKKVYMEKELGIPRLNMVTPVGVEKPKGKKKGKVFVDDRESMSTILAMVQAENEGQIESKMMKARYMEEIREARRQEAEKKEAERKAKLDETKESLRKKRKRKHAETSAHEEESAKDVALTGTKATKPKKKRVSFAA